MSPSVALAVLAAAAWAWLLLARGGFWRIERATVAPAPVRWPVVTAVIPARDEADVIGETVWSLLGQDYRGVLSVVVADDGSADGTAEEARQAARLAGAGDRLAVVTVPPLPPGWAGKVWAQSQGIETAVQAHPDTELWLLTDADILHASDEIGRLVARLLAERLDMASLMVRLSTASLAEKAVVPAFVFFFRLLFPFRWVGDPGRATAAAAGGCMLIRRSALERAGGLASIQGALIDDCALAARIKASGGRLALDLADETASLRRYATFTGLWRMIARSAYTQLRLSPFLLAGTVAAMTVGFLLPPLFVVLGGAARPPALVAWAEMSVAFVPMLRYHRLPAVAAPLLPLVASFYLGATIDSARRHWAGRGGEWKGRVRERNHP